MKAENYQSLYIVKMPNNFCGIGAMMLNHPKNVSFLVSKPIQETLVILFGLFYEMFFLCFPTNVF